MDRFHLISNIYLLGCFPTGIDTVNVNHTQVQSSGDYLRSVTFEYNNCIMIPDEYYAKYYNIDF